MSGPDPFEKLLTDYVSRIGLAWATCEDRTSPLGELAAEAAALLQFYLEHTRPIHPVPFPQGHWSDGWKKEWRR